MSDDTARLRAAEDQAAAKYDEIVADYDPSDPKQRKAFAKARDTLVVARKARRESEGRHGTTIGGDAFRQED